MDQRGLYCPGELDVLHQDRNRSETTICLPSPSPAKRASSYYPAGPKVLEESNLDPFYLEESLAATPSWNPYTSDMRNDSFEDEDQYYTLSLTHKDIHHPSQYGPDRSTLAQVELENSLRFHRYTSSTEEHSPLHSSQVSFSSVHTDSTTPDLTPSSSFSSSYDSPSCPDAVLEATQQLYKHANQVQIEPRRRFYLPASTPPTYSLPPPPPPPVAPLNPADTRPTTPCFQHSNDSTTTITMGYEDTTASCSSRSRRRKQPPSGLTLSRTASSPSTSRRKQSSPGTRPPLDPSMISPPSLINPVTMEPHMTHFDHPLFIPANDCPSPVPSPVASSPPISRQWTATSMERPSISTIDAFCEQSVWESDSDSESAGRKSMSRRPIDTLRKVRSRAKLRAAKSQPKLHQAMLDGQTCEQFPCMPEDILGEPIPEAFRPSMDRPSTSKEAVRAHSGLQTLRLVAPSSASLTRSRSRKNSSLNSSDVDRSAAAAFQAQFRRRQRSDSPEYSNSSSDKGDKEKLTSFCYDQYSHTPTNGAREQRPLFERFMNSLRSLNCQKPQKSHKKTNVTTI
ncbi:hypothetical protein N7489_002301 [Penicillium chrysogenum]|uniref:uncharacterized protein n=1 Tax=Penicillium chrysogenum TaxID=5076 RepID=UPI0024DF2BF4|nr:uncharacterized protein N7489_002301 [Penicillium chrysogenum]KAJ5251891.1 hypothetical protein N7489_002301 [Penicillium chrysogenum]KAJ5853986.1 hypothetical protein N7534_006529 [Penicillium rubens]